MFGCAKYARQSYEFMGYTTTDDQLPCYLFMGELISHMATCCVSANEINRGFTYEEYKLTHIVHQNVDRNFMSKLLFLITFMYEYGVIGTYISVSVYNQWRKHLQHPTRQLCMERMQFSII